MDEEQRIDGYQIECYTTRRDTEIIKQKPTLSKEWRDWLIAECSVICERMYIVKMRDFLNVGEQDVDLSQEAFQGVKLTTIRFDPKRIPYVPAKMKRKVDSVYADLNDDIYHTKRFAHFVKEVLVKNKGVRKLKTSYGTRYDPYLKGLKEWLRRQFLYAYRQYITWSYSENQIRLNKSRNDMSAYSDDISVSQFQAGELNTSSWIGTHDDEETTERLKAIIRMVGGDEELLALMVEKYEGLAKGRIRKEDSLFENFKSRRIQNVCEKYDITEKEAFATSKNRTKYKLGKRKLEIDFENLLFKAEDIVAELKDDY